MRVSLIQLNSTRDVDENLATCRRLAERAAERGTDWMLFPENAPFLGGDGEKTEVAEDLDGPMVGHFADLAAEADAWVTLGSFPEKLDEERTYNTQVLIDPAGDTVEVYRKIHLFDVDVEGGRTFRESDHVRGGDELVSADIEAGGEQFRTGLTICYDLRFPELYRALTDRGASVLTVPSAFTLQTGRDHWHPLLQARAIENQSWILAPNQWGHHFGHRSSYGHSAIYDPWGRRVACASDRETVIHADIDRRYVDQVREKMPCLEHIRVCDDGSID